MDRRKYMKLNSELNQNLDDLKSLLKQSNEISSNSQSLPEAAETERKQDQAIQKRIDGLKKKLNRERINYLFYVLTIGFILIGIVVFYWNDLKIHFTFALRFVYLGINKFIDLSDYRVNSCLIKNPFYESKRSFDESTCLQGCSEKVLPKVYDPDLTALYRDDFFYKHTYEQNTPVIFRDNEIKEWRVFTMSVEDMLEFYSTTYSNGLLKEADICLFDATEDLNFLLNFKDIKSTTANSGHHTFMWENCQRQSSKLLRKLVRRPTFLTKNVELVHTNWIYLSTLKDKESFFKKNYLTLPLSMRISMLVQVKGSMNIHLACVKECKKVCSNSNSGSAKFQLNEGDTLIYSNMWEVKFKQNNQPETITIAFYAH